MSGELFGTDGVRGLANADLTPELALAVASAAARVLAAHVEHRPLAVVGHDPRASSEMLEAAVVAGLTSAGADVLRLGVVPTPAVAFLTDSYGADLGVVLSASHNPMPDNGIKLFATGGHKLDDDIEAEIERAVGSEPDVRPIGAAVGRVRPAEAADERYLAHLLAAVPDRLDGLQIVLDCAHGAAAAVGPEVFRRAGAEVTAIGVEPDGLNINAGVGSTNLDHVRAVVLADGADFGVALDGDADRCLAVDGSGAIVDGDQILALCALALRERGELRDDTVVATVMSNLGFHQAMTAAAIDVITTSVGDRYVLEALRAKGLSIGGEQSGHIVFSDTATTGDGLLTALHLAARIAATGRPLDELAGVVHRLPQVLVNVEVGDKDAVAAAPSVAAAVAAAQAELGGDGRILLRPSGTENLVRVMVEAPTQEQADAVAQQVAGVVRSV